MPFDFSPYRSPYSQTIASLIANEGAIQGQAAQAKGQAWGQAAQTIGQAVGQIPQQIQQQKAQQQTQQIRETQLAQAQSELADAQQKRQDLQNLDRAFQENGRDAILKNLSENGSGHLIPQVTKTFEEQDKLHSEAVRLQEQADALSNDAFANTAVQVRAYGNTPEAAQVAISDLKSRYANDPQKLQQIQQMEQRLHENPTVETVTQMTDALISASPKRAELDLKGQDLQRQIAANQETARHNAEMEKIGTLREGREGAAAEETARHNAAMERLRGQAISTQESGTLKRSYDTAVKQVDTLAKPLRDQLERIGKLTDSINAMNPQADAIIAPELLTAMAGGIGSGVRLNEAEMERVVNGRSHLESLRAALQKWSLDNKQALSITPAQRKDMRDLIKAVAARANEKLDMVYKANQALDVATDIETHKRIVTDLKNDYAKAGLAGAGDTPAPAATTPTSPGKNPFR